MKTLFLTMTVLSLTSTLAFAQQPPPQHAPMPRQNDAPVSAPATPPAAPVPGENSFTETQAKERIADAGYTQVGTLMLDANGVWRGMATKDGRTVNVGLDYQGNVVEQ